MNTIRYLTFLPGVLCALLCMEAVAQDDGGGSPLTFGAKAGLAVSTFSQEQPHAGAKLGFTVGAFAHYSLNPSMGVQLEANYLQQGGRLFTYYDETRFGADGGFLNVHWRDSRVTLHTIEVPVLFTYSLPKENFTPRLYAGPSAGFTLRAEDNFQKTGTLQTGEIVTAYGNDNVTSTYQMFQLGAIGGLGITLPMGNKKLLIDARYRFGVTPARENYSYLTWYETAQKMRTHTVSFTVGLSF